MQAPFDTIRAHALTLGFDEVGFCSPKLPSTASEGLEDFLAAGHHGTMGWMEDRKELRAAPHTLMPEAQSVIVVGHNYAPPFNPMDKLTQKDIGNISAYALNRDYHDIIKKKLKALARWLVAEYQCELKLFVDTAPVMEKPLAQMAGIGWQGKHTCLVSREFGSWLFLGAVFTDLALTEPDDDGYQMMDDGKATSPTSVIHHPSSGPQGHCGSCTACIDICPTNAIVEAGKLDARKCISYLTIEHKGAIPLAYRKAMGNRIYGCDDCLAICPWNKFASDAKESAYHARNYLNAPPLSELVQLDDTAFRALFTKSPIKRIGRDRFVRNVLIAIGNSEEASHIPLVQARLHDDSELVQEAASWAMGELQPFV